MQPHKTVRQESCSLVVALPFRNKKKVFALNGAQEVAEFIHTDQKRTNKANLDLQYLNTFVDYIDTYVLALTYRLKVKRY